MPTEPGETSRAPALKGLGRAAAAFLLVASCIGEGHAAPQAGPEASPGVLLTGRPRAAPDPAPPGLGLVHVEVVVTDDHLNPLTGLSEESFSIQEDGNRRRVLTFQAVDLSESSAQEAEAAASPRVSTNAVEARIAAPRAFVLVFDDLHLGAAGALRAREISEEFLADHARDGDQVILVAPGADLFRSVTLPEGREILVSAVGALEGRNDPESSVEAEGVLPDVRKRRRRLLGAVASALDALIEAPTRKTVLLLSEGFLYEPGDSLTYDVIAASQRAGAAIHFVDLREPAASASPAARGSATGAEILSSVTGGYVVRNRDDLTPTLDRLTREASHHYVLGYRPSGKRGTGRLRRIRVGVERQDVTVVARKGYLDVPETRGGLDPQAGALDAPLREALASPSLIREIPLKLTALPLAPTYDGRVRVALASEAAARGLELEPMPDGGLGATLDVVVAIDHAQGEAPQVVSMGEVVVTVPEGARSQDAWLPFQRPFDLPPGLCQVKLVVRDRASGAVGTVVHHLKVPEPAGLRISTPILSDTPSGDGVQPPRIVAGRDFAPGSVLYCYFEVYPEPGIRVRGPHEAGAAYRIEDHRGKVRHKAALPLAVRRNGKALARLIEVPLTRMEPGRYELIVDLAGEVTGGQDEVRESFVVTRPRRFSDQLYRDALEAYLEGDFQSAVAMLLQWRARQILAAARRIPQGQLELREAAVLLHTDLALVLRKHGKLDGADTHMTIARTLLEGPAFKDLHRDWLLALAYTHQASLKLAEALAFYTECATAFPDVGEARLGVGTLHERSAFLPPGFGRGNLHMLPPLAAAAAERSYEEALRIQPSLTEARLRLARVLQRTDRPDEALEQLALVLEASEDDSLTALAHLFWGQISEARDELDEAIEHYRAALAAHGDLQVAALALAQNLHRRDGRRAAVDVLVPALEVQGTSPWLAYRQGPRGLSTSTLQELRLRLRTRTASRR